MTELDPIGWLPRTSFGGRVRDWQTDRGRINADAAAGLLPSELRWDTNCGRGANLLDEAASVVLDLAAGSMDCWYDNAGHFNCGEAEMVAGLIRLVHGERHAKQFLMAHAEDDDEGDQHWALRSEDAEVGDDD